jgi:hypothetical protein
VEGRIQPIETWYRDFRFRSRLEARWAVFFDAVGIPWRYEEQGYDLSRVRVPDEPGSAAAYTPFWYLPDFYLPEQDCWIEVKPSTPSEREILLMSRLVMGTRRDGYFLQGLRFPHEALVYWSAKPTFEGITHAYYSELPLAWYQKSPGRMKWLDPAFADRDPYQKVGVADGGRMWCECPRCGMVGITYYGDARYLKCGCLGMFDIDSWIDAEIRDDKDLMRRMSRDDPAPTYTYDSPRLMAAYKAARQARFEHRETPQAYVLQSKLARIREILESEDAGRDSGFTSVRPFS